MSSDIHERRALRGKRGIALLSIWPLTKHGPDNVAPEHAEDVRILLYLGARAKR
jgi:hypothetical protein